MNEEVVESIRQHMKDIESLLEKHCPEAQYMMTVQMDSEKEDDSMDVFYGVRSDSPMKLIDMFSNMFELVAAENPNEEEFSDFLKNFGITGPAGEA